MAVELVCERGLWRALSPLGTTRMSAPRSRGGSASRTTTWTLAVAAVAVVLVPAAVMAERAANGDLSLTSVALVVLGILVLVVAGLVAYGLGSSWWLNGAGHPVLQVDGEVVRGRLHSARRTAPAYEGWDFEVPLASITDVRLTAAGHLAVGLPEALTQELLERPTTRTHARQWREVTGQPASWPASRMLGKSHRAEHLDRLVTALSGSAPTEGRQ
ncbi:hypothetical protein [Nocardioides hwasunensis]|uniref:PH domain-containing protein n=1 Tax=Nocardioides hwasunensis TaxID=397258 RepID=A0ABR8MHI7_9ACTN|nr:hypothetical protein [Nocardioides hwasunensis]MBD3915538.1 hypothetical protein [Nocardioides hwasunensis]